MPRTKVKSSQIDYISEIHHFNKDIKDLKIKVVLKNGADFPPGNAFLIFSQLDANIQDNILDIISRASE